MKRDKDFKIRPFMESLETNVSAIFEEARIWTGYKYISLMNLDGYVWSRVFHKKYGPCYTFDLSKIKNFEYVPYTTDARPGLEIILAGTPWY